jgi:hypothetical protein
MEDQWLDGREKSLEVKALEGRAVIQNAKVRTQLQ